LEKFKLNVFQEDKSITQIFLNSIAKKNSLKEQPTFIFEGDSIILMFTEKINKKEIE
jgi:hypothetical protein